MRLALAARQQRQAVRIPADFDSAAFLRVAKLNFVRLQAANDAKNLDDLREFVSPELFAEIKMQMDERGNAPQQTDVVTLSGRDDEFMPRFNYKGFRYVEVVADRPVELSAENLTAYAMHSDVTPVGHIETSNDLVDKLWDATNKAYLSNLMGYPTDCPQREKNGWTGDGHLAIETALYNYDGITVYEKWLADHRDDIAGRVLLMFQPGEEGFHGARYMIEEWLGHDLP